MNLRDVVFARDGGVRAGWRVLLFFGLFFVFFKACGAFTARVHPADYAALQVEQYVCFVLAAWLAHYVMLRWVDHKPWSYVGLGREQLTTRALLIGLTLGALCILIPSGGLLLAHDLTIVTGLQGRYDWLSLAAGGALLFLPQSLSEEMLSRGYLFSALRDGIGEVGALAATSLGFGLLHMGNPGATAQSVGVVVLAGIFLGLILVITRSLYAAWMAHFAWNWSMADLLHAPVSGIRFPYSGYRIDDSGPDWLTGGSWGPEGGTAAAIGMIVGLVLLIAWHRRAARSNSEIA
ncbi:MAG: CPBP family intramembrane glutamic endopeptidase [Gemmatimonadota bacterium]